MKSILAFAFMFAVLAGCGDDEIAPGQAQPEQSGQQQSDPAQQPPAAQSERALIANSVTVEKQLKESFEKKGVDLSKNCFQVVDRKEGDKLTRVLELSSGACPAEAAAAEQVKLVVPIVPRDDSKEVAKLAHENHDVGSIALPSDTVPMFIVLELVSGSFSETNRLDIEHEAGAIKSIAMRHYDSEEKADSDDIRVAKEKADAKVVPLEQAAAKASEALLNAEKTLEQLRIASEEAKKNLDTAKNDTQAAVAASEKREAYEGALKNVEELKAGLARAQERIKIEEALGAKRIADAEANAKTQQEQAKTNVSEAEKALVAKQAEVKQAEIMVAEKKTALEAITKQAELAVGEEKKKAEEAVAKAKLELEAATAELDKVKPTLEETETAVEESAKEIRGEAAAPAAEAAPATPAAEPAPEA